MRQLTSFETVEGEDRFSEQSERTKIVYARMVIDNGYAGSDECNGELNDIADSILKEDDGIMRSNNLETAVNSTASMREYFDSFAVGDIVGVDSYLATDGIDETAGDNLTARRKARSKASFGGMFNQAGSRTAKVVAKTSNVLTVEYLPMRTKLSASSLSQPWRESFSWKQLGNVYKVQR